MFGNLDISQWVNVVYSTPFLNLTCRAFSEIPSQHVWTCLGDIDFGVSSKPVFPSKDKSLNSLATNKLFLFKFWMLLRLYNKYRMVSLRPLEHRVPSEIRTSRQTKTICTTNDDRILLVLDPELMVRHLHGDTNPGAPVIINIVKVNDQLSYRLHGSSKTMVSYNIYI